MSIFILKSFGLTICSAAITYSSKEACLSDSQFFLLSSISLSIILKIIFIHKFIFSTPDIFLPTDCFLINPLYHTKKLRTSEFTLLFVLSVFPTFCVFITSGTSSLLRVDLSTKVFTEYRFYFGMNWESIL